MCVTSVIHDYGKESWDRRPWAPTAIEKYHDLIDAAQEFDEVAGEPDCEDPKKAEFLKELEDRVGQVERKVSGEVSMTVDLWCGLLTAAGITLEQLENDEVVAVVAVGPMILNKDANLPMIVFQTPEQAEDFNAHYDEIKQRLGESHGSN